MSIRKYLSRRSATCCLAAGLGLFTGANAQAAIVIVNPNADFAMTPYTISLGGGSATFTFTDISSTSNNPSTVDAVSTGGNGMVNAFIEPISFQQGSVIGDTGYGFAAFPTPAGIQFSLAKTSIGVEFSQSDGIHYGFVTVLGPEVLQYGFNSTPGGFISTSVPEPATWALLIAGFGALGSIAWIRRSRALRAA